MPSQNREQRRAAKFGRHRSLDQGRWPESTPNPALGGPSPTSSGDEAVAGRPDEDQAADTGQGAGDATETDSAKG